MFVDGVTKKERYILRLVALSFEIYDQIKLLAELESNELIKSKKYKESIEILRILCKRENVLCEKIADGYEDICESISMLVSDIDLSSFGKGSNLVIDRLSNKLGKLADKYCFTISISFDDEEKEFFLDDDNYIDLFQKMWKLEYLLKLQCDSEKYHKIRKRSIMDKYELIFTDKELLDDLVSVDFNVAALLDIEKYITIENEKLSVSESDEFFEEMKAMALYDLVNDLYLEVVTTKNRKEISQKTDMFKFLISKLDTDMLLDLKECIDFNDVRNNDSKHKRIKKIVHHDLSLRGDLPINGEHNKYCEPVKREVLDILFPLIKLEEKILELYDYLLVFQTNDVVHKLEVYLEFEDSLLSQLSINSNVATIIDLLNNHLPFLIENELDCDRKCYLIKERLLSAIRVLEEEESSDLVNDLTVFITDRHVLSSLLKFKDKIMSLPKKEKESFTQIYYDMFYIRQGLSMEFVLSHKHSTNVELGDDLSVILSGVNDIEYGYEKNNTLLNRCLNNIDVICFSEITCQKDEAFLMYILVEITNIIDNVNLETLAYIADYLDSALEMVGENEFTKTLSLAINTKCESKLEKW